MPNAGCPFPGCDYQTDDGAAAIVAAQLNIHALSHQPTVAAPGPPGRRKPPPMERPTISRECSAEDWEIFTRKWKLFKQATDIPEAEITNHLWQCCESSLSTDLFKQLDDVTKVSEITLLEQIKVLAVVNIAASVRKANLLSSRQERDQPIRSFAAKVQGTARICAFTKACPKEDCGQIVDYTDEIVKHIVISGIADDTIRRDVLSLANLDNLSLADTIRVIETKEIASRALLAPSPMLTLPESVGVTCHTAALGVDAGLQAKLAMTTKCKSCGRDMNKYKLLKGRYRKSPQLREFSLCLSCWKAANPKPSPRSGERNSNDVASLSNDCDHSKPTLPEGSKHVVLEHYIFDGTHGWLRQESKLQPTVRLTISTRQDDYRQFRSKCPIISPCDVQAITDTGAQSSLMGLEVFRQCGFTSPCLLPVAKRLYAANEEGINLLGALLVRLAGKTHSGQRVETAEMVYVTDSTKSFYLSRHAMEQLRIIGPDFPRIGAAAITASDTTMPPVSCTGDPATCQCSPRQPPPGRPLQLPFTPSVANNAKMKQWLIDRYASSTFNKCKCQLLPTMSGPPISINIEPDAPPSAVHTPAPVPIHWRDEVKSQLDADVRLGVVEKVAPNTPTLWCHRAIWVRKPDGNPRRVVDFQALNKHCARDTHHIMPPFKQARLIPPGTFRSVTDAWNGYHSVPVRECDRHLLTFITEFGRYRYCVAPQGFVASGDGYSQRYDKIIADLPRKTKCVDDTVLWDDSLEDHWWRMIDYLALMGREGIVLNPSKFQFACQRIEFAGFEVTADSVRPLAKYLDAIRYFPTPKNISDIRAWFGLVNQVSHYNQLTEIMTPFKSLLSARTPFCWTEDLDKAFAASKLHLIDAIKDGVRIFDPTKLTCLSPDWSKQGIGYWLRQKYCDCDSINPDCCVDGWRITLAGSRFLRNAEQRYAPIEGEALAVAWSLEDTKFFTMGCDNLIITTDHKPLVKIFGDKSLDEITNTRIFRLKQRTLSWRFRIIHVPGKLIPASDAFSRHPVSVHLTGNDSIDPSSPRDNAAAELDITSIQDVEGDVIAATRASLNAIEVIKWEDVTKASLSDPSYTTLKQYIVSGFPDGTEEMPIDLQSYWRYRARLSIVDDVIMYDDRVVIPQSLRSLVCQILHSAHQGTSAMSQRAQATVFWPGMSSCIDQTRAQCDTCSRTAPSQPHLPPITPFVPTYPFQCIAADYCSVAGQDYLISVDRFSNWPEIFPIKPGSQTSGARGLQDALRSYFATFGVVEELSSDGGPEFAAFSTREFLRKWGVRHRISSAYNSRSNGRAEVAVKSMKRLIQGNVSRDGDICTDSFTRAILQFRNCPDPDNGLSPAQIVFGRPLKDALPFHPGAPIFKGTTLQPMWRDLWRSREQTLRTRYARQVETLSSNTKPLPPLHDGDFCRIQNQHGRFPTRWDRTGMVVQCKDHDQYLVKMDGSGRLTLRNRKYLRRIDPLHRLQPITPPSTGVISPPPTPSQRATINDADDTAPSEQQHQRNLDEEATTDECRRSTRIRRPPSWHSDYVIGGFAIA